MSYVKNFEEFVNEANDTINIKGKEWKFDMKANKNLSQKEKDDVVEILQKEYFEKAPLPEANNKVKIVPGGDYTLSQFSNSLGKVSSDAPKRKFIKNDGNGYYVSSHNESVSKEDVANLILGVGDKYNVFKYFNTSYSAFGIKIETLGSIEKKVESNNIYSLMAAPSYDIKEITFKVKVSYSEPPITVTTRFIMNSTLSMRDIVSFM